MKKLLFSLSLLWATHVIAQETVIDSTKHWSVQGQNTLMLNQAAFSNWVGGGANNIGLLAQTIILPIKRIKNFGKTT